MWVVLGGRAGEKRQAGRTLTPLPLAVSFNTLHDHGTATWSAVYYVANGEGTPDQQGPLLLRTQLARRTQNFGFVEVAPTPGTLVIFPGYVPHAVLPRRFPLKDDPAKDLAPLHHPSLRVSVACNILLVET